MRALPKMCAKTANAWRMALFGEWAVAVRDAAGRGDVRAGCHIYRVPAHKRKGACLPHFPQPER